MALFPHDSFVVVDIPARLALHVRGLRRDYGSARQFLPAEITLAGSSGVGVFAAEQDADEALRALGRIAGASQPFDFELGAVERFPDSGLFYYAIKDPAPLVALHQRLVTSGLRFKPSSFAFSPHLTIDTFEDATPQLEAELRALPVPAGLHRAASISVYSLHGWETAASCRPMSWELQSVVAVHQELVSAGSDSNARSARAEQQLHSWVTDTPPLAG